MVTGDGRWKLVLPHRYRTLDGKPGGQGGHPAKYTHRDVTAPELYDLREDPSETTDVSAQEPQRVQHLLALAERFRADLGDSLTQHRAVNARAPGRVTGARTSAGAR